MQGHALKAELEFERHNYRRAARILNSAQPLSASAAMSAQGLPGQASSTTQPAALAGAAESAERMSRGYTLANAGCIAHRQQQHNMAALCFSNAMRQCASAQVGWAGLVMLSRTLCLERLGT